MQDANYLTPEGKEKLERELKDLIEVKRPALAQKLKEAIADGDLKENANYHDAKEQQAFIENRIREVEHILRSAVVIEETQRVDIVQIGSRVTVVEDGFDDAETYKIVGAAEAAPSQGLISNESPIGAALLNKRKGDSITVDTPDGKITFKILGIE